MSLVTSAACQQDASWAALVQQFPADLDALAFQHGALYRRRKFRSAATLLRLLLAYAAGLSMPLVAAWAAQCGLLTVTPEALQARLAHARHWLQALVLHLLTGRTQAGKAVRRLLLIDGTHAPRPGARSQDWRLHLCWDLQQGTLTDARVQPQTPGESFAQAALQAGDLVLGDRNYGTRRNIHLAHRAGAAVLVRFVVKNLPLQTPDGEPFPLTASLPDLAPEAIASWEVTLAPTTDLPPLPGRVIVARLSAEQADRATQAQRRRRSRSGRHRTTSPATVAGWQYVVLFTTLSASQLSAEAAIRLYRCRWQIELAIKRYKSLCGLGTLRARTDASCQAELWAKLLLILLLEQRGHATALFPPGIRSAEPSHQPVACRGPVVAGLDSSDSAHAVLDRLG